MSWNNGKERKLFEKRQEVLAEQYRAVGMTEEQIQQMYKFDLAVFRSERVFYTHTQALEINFDDEDVCEVSNYLLKYHQTSFFRDYSNRYWWVNELEKLYQAAMSLSDEEKELVTLYVFDGYTQQEIADKFHCSQMAISKRLRKIKKAFLPAKGGNAND